MDNYLQPALDFAARGLAVFPLVRHKKTPLIPAWQERATTNADQVRRWWTDSPGANIGIACGLSGLVVIDLDVKNDTSGLVSWETLCQDLGLDVDQVNTLSVATPSGGKHLYFLAPDGQELRNTAGTLAKGIDTRANGGYVVAPPSVTPEGVYTWLEGEIKPLPAPLLALLLPKSPEKRADSPPQRPPARDRVPYVQAALDTELDRVRNAPPGTRNNSLNIAALSLGELVAAPWAGLRADKVESLLLDAALSCGLGEKEAAATIQSGMMKGIAQPRPEPVSQETSGVPWPTEPPPDLVDEEETQRVRFNCTDLGNAERLTSLHGCSLHFCYAWDRWLIWDGARWRLDETGRIYRLAKHTARMINKEAADCLDDEQRGVLRKWAGQSESRVRIDAMIKLAESEPKIPVLSDDLDADPWLFTVQNGTLDLRTGELLPHRREDLITKLAPVSFTPDATCPTFVAFLNRIMDGNQALIEFIQRAIGYSLTGSTRERALFILHGTGANGKSTLLETIRALLGDYAMRTPTKTLMNQRSDQVPNDVARLKGARFVSASESEESQHLAESLIKDLTGGDTISARFMRAEWFEFRPECKIWLGTNHKPQIRGTDRAIWDRIKLIPFLVRIPDEEQDKALPARLLDELPGILNWALAGCLAWQRQGLRVPAEVRRATGAYQNEMDAIGAFLDDAPLVQHINARIVFADLYEMYKEWAENGGEFVLSKRKFGERMTERGFIRERGTQNAMMLFGIGKSAQEEFSV